jgi:hypothetical protein
MTSGEPIVRDSGARETRPVFGTDRPAGEAPAEGTNRAHLFSGRRTIGALAAAALAACGAGAGSTPSKSGTATHAPATSAAAPVSALAALPPPGGPAPAELIGSWYQVASRTTVLTLTATVYILRDTGEQGSGDIVVNGNEIDFFSGTLCPLVLPRGVGRYQWTLQGANLRLAPLNMDPCGRIDLLTNQSYTKSPS